MGVEVDERVKVHVRVEVDERVVLDITVQVDVRVNASDFS